MKNRNRILCGIVSICLLITALFVGCNRAFPSESAGTVSATQSATGGIDTTNTQAQTTQEESGSAAEAVVPLPSQKGGNTVKILENRIMNLNLSGEVGRILAANEQNWVQKILEDNPGLFEGFLNPQNGKIGKCMWHGEFPGKLLTGIAQTYLTHRDPETQKVGDRFVETFGKAQNEDGYLGPWKRNQQFERDVSSSNLGKWDTWGQYHCIYGLYRWYQVTGNRQALEIAQRALDNIYDHFITGNISLVAQNWAECNLAIGHAFALFYEETGEEKYLQAAERIVNQDWKDTYLDFYSKTTLSCNWMDAALAGKPYYASGQPRWEGLYALETLATLYRITGKEEYNTALANLWWGMVQNDRHNTGSFGTGEGATGNLYGAGSETCNTVAWMAFSTEYLAISRDSRVADELELSFFNATLGSLLDGERNFTYMNNSDGTREAARITLEGHSYLGARDMSCCQANGNRGLSQLTEWALLSRGDSLYLNYYGQSGIETRLESGHRVEIAQETEYPRNGQIRIRVNTDCERVLTLNLRIPAWSVNTRLTVNGEELSVCAGQYASISRVWSPDDTIELVLDMAPHFWVSDQTTMSFRVSAYTGPILLAFRTSDDVRATSRFNVEDLRNLTAVPGDGLVNFASRTATEKDVMLTDYYTAGKHGEAYVSWLVCISDMTPIKPDQNTVPIWCNR